MILIAALNTRRNLLKKEVNLFFRKNCAMDMFKNIRHLFGHWRNDKKSEKSM